MSLPPSSRLVSRIRSRRGFALIVAITLLGFIILLLVTLNTLTNVETVVAESSATSAQAREYAKQSLQEAIGKLQRYAGPDTRVTSTGEILQGQIKAEHRLGQPAGSARYPKAHDSFKRWTIVWDSGEKKSDGVTNNLSPAGTYGKPLAWLVSGNSDDALIDPLNRKPLVTGKLDENETSKNLSSNGLNRWIMLVSGRSIAKADTKLTGKDATDPANAVYAELEDIEELAGDLNVASTGGTKKLVGRKAWWVGDNGVKAKINIGDKNKDLSGDAALVRTVAPQRANPASTKNFEAYTNLTADSLAKAITFDTLQFVEGAKVKQELLANYVHDFTTDGYGVAADVRRGGLKVDLNTALLDNNFMANKPIFKPASGGNPTPQDPGGPLWEQYKSFYKYRAPSAGADIRAQTNKTSGIYPVVVTAQMFWAPSIVTIPATTPTGTPTYRVFHHAIPAVVLWNPYNVALAAPDGGYSVCFLRNTTPATGSGYSPANFWLDNCRFTVGTTTTNSTIPDPLRARIVMQIRDVSLEPGQAVLYSLDKHISYEINNYQGTEVVLKPGFNPLGFSLVCGGYGSSSTYTVTSAAPTYTAAPQGTRRGALELYEGALTLKNFNLNGGRIPVNEATTPLVFAKKLNSALETSTRAASFIPVKFNMTGATASSPGSLPGAPLFASEADWTKMYGRKYTMRFAEHSQDPYFDVYANNQSTHKTRWLANNNPRSAIVGRRSVEYGSTSSPIGYFTPATFLTDLFYPDKAFRVIKIGNNDEPLVGFSDIDGPTNTTLFEIPLESNPAHFVSLGQLMHANLSNYSSSNWLDIYQNGYSAEEFYSEHNIPAFALGNSLGDLNVNNSKVEVTAETTEGYSGYYVYDWSWKLNDALWDRYFFSSMPTTANGQSIGKLIQDNGKNRLPNGRMTLVSPNSGENPEDLVKDFQKAAAGVLVDGAFNVNSTSVDAWKALLSSFFGVAPKSKTADPLKSPFAGVIAPVGTANTGNDGYKDQNSYNGYRVLSVEEIDFLARQIVVQVKKRGPFLSLSDFVNRSYTSTDTANPEIQRVGALHAALDTTDAGSVWNPKSASDAPKINKKFYESKNYVIKDNEVDPTYWGQRFGSYGTGSVFEGLPGYLTQADLLYHLGPVLSARSDSFVIRSYGEVRDPQNPVRIISRAWCEAVVQRTNDYVDLGSANPDKPWATNAKENTTEYPGMSRPQLSSAANKTFGRRFVVTSFRWLSPDEI